MDIVISNNSQVQNVYFPCRKVISTVFRVDHSQDWNDENAFFLSESSFTVADWILMDLICNNPSLAFHENLPTRLILRLFFNVLPGGRTFLHNLVVNRDVNSLNMIETGF